MWPICKKEFRQFFSSFIGLIAISVFLLWNWFILFVYPDLNIFDSGYATLDTFFSFSAPAILFLLVPAITMRTFAEEFRVGTFEILQTRPLSRWQILLGKFCSSILIFIITLCLTIIYVITIKNMSAVGSIDVGGIVGSYIGLFFLAAVFTSIGVFCSSLSSNAVIAFIISALLCLLLWRGFHDISRIPIFNGGADYYIDMLGIEFHYQSIGRGVIDSRDLIYFLSIITFFLFFTHRNLVRR